MQAALKVRFRQQRIIFVRKTLQVRLRDRNMLCMFQARKAGPAFFDEDEVCGRVLDLGCSLPGLTWELAAVQGRLLLSFVSGCKAYIFVRKTLQVRLRDRNMLCMFQARKTGPAFFDEDDVCGRALDLGCSLPELELYYTRYQPF